MVVLDTDHVSLLHRAQNAESQRLLERLNATSRSEVATTIVTFEEQARGWLSVISRAKAPEQLVHAYHDLSRFRTQFQVINVLDFDRIASDLLSDLIKQRLRIGSMDLRIAAIVLARDATLLTRNKRDFGKVPGLRIEDWTA